MNDRHLARDLELMDAEEENRGEFGLWLAVLVQAVDDLHRKGQGFEIVMNGVRLKGRADSADVRRNRRNAATWFSSPGRDVGSFLWICDLFGLDADRFRARVKNKNFRLPR